MEKDAKAVVKAMVVKAVVKAMVVATGKTKNGSGQGYGGGQGYDAGNQNSYNQSGGNLNSYIAGVRHRTLVAQLARPMH